MILAVLLHVSMTVPQTTGRLYHKVTLTQVATTRHTHIEVCGPVAYVRKQADGDWHLTLDDGQAKVVVEIIPAIPLPPPRKRDLVRVRGIVRYDKEHAFNEIHPAEWLATVKNC